MAHEGGNSGVKTHSLATVIAKGSSKVGRG